MAEDEEIRDWERFALRILESCGEGGRGEATGRSASVGICSAEAQGSEAAAARARSKSEYSGDEVEVEVDGWGEQMRWKVERMKRRERNETET